MPAAATTSGDYDHRNPEERTLKYLCMVWFDGTQLDVMPAPEKAAFDRESMDYDRSLEARGNYIHAEALQSPSSARTVRVRGGKMTATDGPFVETKEYLGGFILIDAKDMDEAVTIAAGIPLARLGAIEVRPIYEIPGA